MSYQIEKQYSLFDAQEVEQKEDGPQPGEWVEDHGSELTFEQITQMVGKMIVMDMSTESSEFLMAVRVEKIVWNEGMRRLVYFTGSRQRGLVNELYFRKEGMPNRPKPQKAYMVKGQDFPFPCCDCVFDNCGRCDHVEDKECFCVNGSFQITHESGRCPKCGKKLEIVQSNFGSDGGRCHKCGTNVIFNNQGNRPGAYELWKRGELIGV